LPQYEGEKANLKFELSLDTLPPSPHPSDRVTMYVFEEMIEGKKLTEIINTTHENVKYLPGHKLPENIVSEIATIKTTP
jgi:glycerol-3-phosphate dehydrogenase